MSVLITNNMSRQHIFLNNTTFSILFGKHTHYQPKIVQNKLQGKMFFCLYPPSPNPKSNHLDPDEHLVWTDPVIECHGRVVKSIEFKFWCIFTGVWVRIPVVTLVSLSKILYYNCSSSPRGKNGYLREGRG